MKNDFSSRSWIAAEIGSGAQIITCRHGPFYLLRRWHSYICSDYCHVVSEKLEYWCGDNKMSSVIEFVPRLAETVKKALYKSSFPVILGGDHSCAIGTWSGIADFYRKNGPIGLIWIDAHYDSHTFETSESKAPHGMPLAALLGYGDKNLTHLYGWGAKIQPAHIVLLGVRSYEQAEYDLLKHLQVRIIDINEIHMRGIMSCIKEAINIVSFASVGFGVTFDLDAIDPSYAPGVGSPEPDGLTVYEAIKSLEIIKQQSESKLLGFELVEYNPKLDDTVNSTAKICDNIINVMFQDFPL